MNIVRSQPQPQQQRNKVKNILIRHCGSKEARSKSIRDKNYQHPENAYLVKYFPKYYKSLTVVMKPQHSLLSKIKRIKKLRRFTGNFNDQLPQANWFKILANNRKEIEEFPTLDDRQIHSSFWTKATLHTVKFFFRITKLQLPIYHSQEFKSKDFFVIWETFSKHLRNMRRLKILKIEVREPASAILRPFFTKLNGFTRLLGKLEVMKSPLRSSASHEILLPNKNTFSHLTNLNYILASSKPSQVSQFIPQICKNLTSFSLIFGISRQGLNANLPQLLGFMIPIQELPLLQCISIDWSDSWSHNLWSYFIPPASLRRLTLRLNAPKMFMEGIDIDYFYEYERFFDHWEEIKELDALDLSVYCTYIGDLLLTKNFLTAMLKKISRLISFQCWIGLDLENERFCRYEPFIVEEVPHLYESLKNFQVDFAYFGGSVRFDFGFLKPFENLKEIYFQGDSCIWVNIGDAVCLLEKNMKDREFLTLKLGNLIINSQEELKYLLKQISVVKKDQTNLKIILALEFKIYAGDDEIMYLDQFCRVIESEILNGLEISLDMKDQECYDCNIDDVRAVLDKYPGLKNFVLLISYDQDRLEYIKRDGEKEQLLFYLYR